MGGIILFSEVITEQKQSAEKLRTSEKRFRRFYESGMLGVIFWEMSGKITDANDKFLEMVGYTREELNNGMIDWGKMTPPEYQFLDDNSRTELKATGVNKAPFEKEYIRKDGTRIPIIIAGAMLDEERFDGVAFALDITEHKQAEERLRESEERFRTLIEQSVDGVVLIDEQGHIIEWNPAEEIITGIPKANALGDSSLGYSIPDTHTRASCKIKSRASEEGLPRFRSKSEMEDDWENLRTLRFYPSTVNINSFSRPRSESKPKKAIGSVPFSAISPNASLRKQP